MGLEYVKRAPSRLLLKFRSGTHGLFEELGRHAKGGSHKCRNCGACKESVSFGLFEGSPSSIEAFIHGSIFSKTAFCLGEKQRFVSK